MNKIESYSDQLLPCPFCGKMPQWVHKVHPSGVAGIQCDECQFLMKQDRKDKTVFYWNRRNWHPNVCDAAMDLQLPVKFRDWEHSDNCKQYLESRAYFESGIFGAISSKELYAYWLENIYTPESVNERLKTD